MSINHQNIMPEFLLLDIVIIVKTFGGEVGGFGGEAFPLHPPVDETLPNMLALHAFGIIGMV